MTELCAVATYMFIIIGWPTLVQLCLHAGCGAGECYMVPGPETTGHWCPATLVSAPRGDHRARSRDPSPANGSATLGPAPPITAALGSGQSPPSRRMWRGWRVESRGPSHYTSKCGYRKYFFKTHKYLLYLYHIQG